MRFDETLADGAVALRKIEVTRLTADAMEFFRLARRGAVAFNFAVKRVFAGLRNRAGWRNAKFLAHIGLRLDVGIDAAAITQRPIGAHNDL